MASIEPNKTTKLNELKINLVDTKATFQAMQQAKVVESNQLYFIEENDDYTLPIANDNALGGIKTGYPSSGKNYGITVNSDGQAYVTVNWENTQTVTGVKGGAETNYRTKNVNITKANIGLGNVENTALSTWTGSNKITSIGTLSSGTVPWARLSGVPNGATKEGTVTSLTIETTSPITGGNDTATTTTGSYTIALTDAYGDTKNPYGSKTKNYVLAAPSTAEGVPSFRKLVAADIPSLNASKITAGQFANERLANSKVTIAGNDVSLGESLTADALRISLGLSNAMHFIGVAKVAITDGSTTDPQITGYSTKTAGDVIIDKDSSYEYVWSSANKWERLGGDSSYKTTQSVVNSPSANGSTTAFIDTISQNANGVITVTKKNLDTSGTWSGNAGSATKLSTTGTTGQFWRGDNTWSDTFTDTLSVKNLNITGTSTPYIKFNKDGYNYIDFPKASGTVAFVGTADDYVKSADHSSMIVSSTYVFPGTTDTIYLGKSNNKWKSVFATTFIGDLTGNADTATKLETARSLTTKLDSTTAVTFDGSADQNAIPVTGTLPVTNGGTGVSSFTANQVVMSGTSTTAALTTRAVTNNTSNTAATANTNIPTMNTLFYTLAQINNANQTHATNVYAPTTAGTVNQILVSAGGMSAPIWKATANGAAYATADNGELTFGTLPIAQGGTGAINQSAAVNNLQAWSLSGGSQIPENADLNAYKTFGNYYQNATIKAKTILNNPYNDNTSLTAFQLKVISSTGAGSPTYIRQELYEYDKNYYFVRQSSNTGNSWTSWVPFNTLSRVYASATDLDVPLIGQNSANSITATWNTYTNTFKDGYGAIPNNDEKRAKINLSSGMVKMYDLTITDQTAPRIAFTRSSLNYLEFPRESGSIAVVGTGTIDGTTYSRNSANSSVIISKNSIYPGTTDTINLGTSTKEWAYVYSKNYIVDEVSYGTTNPNDITWEVTPVLGQMYFKFID